MICGNAFAIWNSCGLWAIRVSATYKEALNTSTTKPKWKPSLRQTGKWVAQK